MPAFWRKKRGTESPYPVGTMDETIAIQQQAPVRVEARAKTAIPRVAVVIVTWNRREDASNALAAVARQKVDLAQLDVVVVDNHSQDGTIGYLRDRWQPERIVLNPTPAADKPRFLMDAASTGLTNAAGFRSLSLIRNADNFGGCGGFNTGLSYVWDVLEKERGGLDFVWLVDDDIDLPEDALSNLISCAQQDETIGLVGSRTVDLGDRETTIETTVYLDPRTGLMRDEAPRGHRLHEAHRTWAAQVGGPKGGSGYEGVREVDVVSACSLLARWSGVRRVGLWDARYFIYCDDADWSVRFARAGYKVVLNLDAVVYHTPWHHKLTPARLYYAQRNLLWMLVKAGLGRRVVARRVFFLLRESLKAMLMRRLSHAEITRRAVLDAAINRGGRLDDPSPKPEAIMDALERAGALRRDARVLATCPRRAHRRLFAEVRSLVESACRQQGRAAPSWAMMLRSDVPGPERRPDEGDVEIVRYSPSRRSRLYRQLRFLLHPPRVVLIFDNANDVPILRGGWNLHIDSKDPSSGRLERDSLPIRLRFLARWFHALLRSLVFVARLPRPKGQDRYG